MPSAMTNAVNDKRSKLCKNKKFVDRRTTSDVQQAVMPEIVV